MTRGVATALGAALHRRLGRGARREIASRATHSTPSSRLARGKTCPPPGVNRDPPAQAPAGTLSARRSTRVVPCTGARKSEAKKIPSRSELPRPVGTQRSAVAARAQRAHTRAMKPTPARGVEAEVRGHGELGAGRSPFCGWQSREARLSVAPHLPTADSGYSDYLRTYSGHERRFWFLQASARACSSSRHAWDQSCILVWAPVGDRAGRGSAHDRARVRARVTARAWQRVRRRLSASRHGVAVFKRLFRGVEPARTLLKVPTPWTFFSLLLAKPRLGAV